MLKDLHSFKQRIALWILGLALPSGAALKPYIRAALFGVIAAAAGGVLIAFSMAVGLAGFYYYLLDEGISVTNALLILGGVTVGLAIAAVVAATTLLNRSSDFPESLELFNRKNRELAGAVFDDLLNAFLSGILKEQEEEKPVKRKAAA